MRRKDGFTLIELLAVIVILAVIALIATPIIMNVINDAKKGAAKDAMYGYVKAVELASAASFDASNVPNGTYQTQNGNLKKDSETLNINFKGTKPKDGGEVVLNYGTVTSATLEFNGFEVRYDGMKATIGESNKPTPTPTPTPSYQVYQPGEVIYFNPETNTKCSSNEAVSTTGTKSGCMKWNVVTTQDKDTKKTVNIMLDHNTTATVAWGLPEYMSDVIEALNRDTASWISGLRPRIIDGQEIADITGREWNASGSWIEFPEFTWLYQNLVPFNDGVPNGYWTSSVSGTYLHAWYVIYDGGLDDYDEVGASTMYGVRPVVTVQKSILS